MSSKSPFYPHQRRALEKAHEAVFSADPDELEYAGGTQGFLIAHQPGMGKTLSALAFAKMEDAERVLVLTNKTGIGVWRAEVRKWWGERENAIVWNGHTPSLDRSLTMGHKPMAFITNYDQLLASKSKELLRTLQKWKPDLLVLDESQNIKSPTAQRTKAVLKLAKDIPLKLLLSGTPAHSPLDYWQQMRLIAPDEYPWNMRFSEYKKWVAVLGGPHQNWVVGFRKDATKKVEEAMAPYMDIGTVDELQLPEPIFTSISVPLDPEERRVYKEMEQKLRIEMDGQIIDAPVVLTKLMKLQQITGGHVLGQDNDLHAIGTSKLWAVLELLRERSSQKVIIACRFRHEIKELRSQILNDGEGRPIAEITGDTSAERRKEIEEWFQSTSEPAILLIQNQAGGISLTLTAADALILYSVDPSTITYQQVVGRVYRIGQKTHVQIIKLIAEDSIDEDLFEGLERKLELVDLVKVLRRGIETRGVRPLR